MKDFIKKHSRIIHLAAVLLLAGLFVFPLWKVTLEAAQYPEGIDMYIWLDKITGSDPNTLNNINILNHYIGMQPIEPDSIPELQYFPYVVLFLILSGILVFFLNKKGLRLTWLIILVILAGLGLYDFYLWEYDYGHNLDPNAAIKIPGMTYQPPLLGAKWLLNFKAISLPHVGGILMTISILIATLVSLFEFNVFKGRKKQKHISVILSLAFLLAACDIQPEPINYGHDSCAFCSMVIMDERYGSEAVTEKGRILKFDSIECLVKQLKHKTDDETGFKYLLVTDYAQPQTLTDATHARYLISKNMPSPMGAFLTGFADQEDALQYNQENGGTLYTWEELQEELE